MASGPSSPPPLQARSITRGRVRWEARALYRAPRLAAETERRLLARPGIRAVRANPLTGRLLVFHAAGVALAQLEVEVRVALQEAAGELHGLAESRGDRLPRPSPELVRTVVVGGGALAGGAVISLAAASLTPLLLGASVFVLTLAANEVTRLFSAEGPVPPRALRRLAAVARPYRRRILIAAVLGAGSVLTSMVRVFFMGSAINLLGSRGTAAARGRPPSGFGFRIALLGGVGLLANALHASLEYAAVVQWRKLAEEAPHRLRLEVYAHIQALEVSNVERRRHGELLAILGNDVGNVQGLFLAAWDLFRMALRVVPSCIVYLFAAPRVAWVTLAWVPVILKISARLYDRTLPLQRAATERQATLMAHLSESLKGFETIKSYTIERYQLKRVRELGRQVLGESSRAIEVGAAFSPLLEILIMAGTVTTMAGAAAFGGPNVSSGTYSILLMLTGQLYWPLTDLGRISTRLQGALVSLDRVYDLLEEEVREPSGPQPLDPRRVRGEILVDHVVFGYNGAPVLRDIRLRLARGRTTAIVGPTGSGKSTLVKLLLRFYDVQQGAVLLDGEDLRNFAVRDLRRAVALASQTPFLFFGSVRENIALGDPGAPLAAVRKAARWAQAHRFIEELPHGYESRVEEHGQTLSGGERQRISLARALMRDAPVLLLDEATSQVDNRTEAAIVESLRKVREGRTTIVIAHRLSAVRDADYIYVLDRGRVVEEGVHDELVRLGGTYAALWRLQSGSPSPSAGETEA